MKRTIENCSIIKKMMHRGLGKPGVEDERCVGYATSDVDDEPCDVCKRCYLNTTYNDEVEFWIDFAGRMGAW